MPGSTQGLKRGKTFGQRILVVAEKLRELRKRKGYTSYEKFSWDHDLSRMQYWRMETGTNFSFTTLLKVLDIHKLTLAALFSDIDT